MSSPSPLRWRSAPRDAIDLREWHAEMVVRNERSGSTHLLGPLAGRVLRVLLDAPEPLALKQISAALSDGSFAAHAPEALTTAVQSVLSEFRRLELAEPMQQ